MEITLTSLSLIALLPAKLNWLCELFSNLESSARDILIAKAPLNAHQDDNQRKQSIIELCTQHAVINIL